ncbi:ABC transporter permease [Paraburkholderia caballeronis]|uniref:ABC-2 type transport system permease protein n=1 Tax=Paraburkholderia caballeronis TaxID=416943 RepID=A0A1H7P8I1_9BURK|nr:ABC transporter permease [Paraburkholderia caballeronis]PXW25340.1 ABC-2 type transport system permease protein [Paraburkholderia caballeronis]PXX00947.1 ABC-2 type transport system permease protein [Paraburkholderia caballeronis]RAJ99700.1 ABC-2 type transport system permease protein [Paraburkholderia caballeronis]SEE41267.1 ABC-2 type transport system permease protein [Paraburkholderia caballeronis]SEL31946.1 ABC-2 type transport system permease protein [Paraburkholderia caballeronis]
MTQWLKNVARLARKEIASLARDATLMVLIAFAFTFAIYSVAKWIKAEVSNASVAFVDGDRSDLSRQLRAAILPPYFKPPVDVDRRDVDRELDRGRYIFAIEIPPRFEADVLAGRAPAVQVLVDATAMTQAGLGSAYLQQIFMNETLAFLHAREAAAAQLPAEPVVRVLFNPNTESFWFTSTMQIVMNITVLSIILVGAAVIREREHGTIEHLLVMPVRASEIAAAKIAANGAVIFVVSLLSLGAVVEGWLRVPLEGSLALFAFSTALYLFSVTALGMLLATLAPSMPQFGLLAVPTYAVAYLLSGAATPVQSMPAAMQPLVQLLPTTQFVTLTQAVLFRAAGVDVVWPQLAGIAAAGALFLALALTRFRSMLARQG